jgi:hypothetical protein
MVLVDASDVPHDRPRTAVGAAEGEAPVTDIGAGRVPQGRVLLVAASGAFLAFLDATIVNVAFPSIRESFPGTSIGDLSWVLNAYNIVFAAFLVVFGRLADLLGRRRTFVPGVVLFTVASLACGLAPSVDVPVAARVLQALGAGLGPPVGGALVEVGGWRWAFLVNLPLGAAAVVVARHTLVESRAPGRRRLPDLRGAALLAAPPLAAARPRVVAGRWVGLVLAGGGARAFAHIGVLCELEEAGVAVDRVAGASVGALLAAVHATGVDGAELDALAYRELVRRRPFSDDTLPVVSLARGRRMTAAMARVLGADTVVEGLPRQFHCASTDLVTRTRHVHRRGSLGHGRPRLRRPAGALPSGARRTPAARRRRHPGQPAGRPAHR